jgi:hypothetical protein
MDERAVLWHVLVWDLWFVVWGAALTAAIFSYRGGAAALPVWRAMHVPPEPR